MENGSKQAILNSNASHLNFSQPETKCIGGKLTDSDRLATYPGAPHLSPLHSWDRFQQAPAAQNWKKAGMKNGRMDEKLTEGNLATVNVTSKHVPCRVYDNL